MGTDMPAETCYHIMEFHSDPLGFEWEASRRNIVYENQDDWSRDFGLRGRSNLRPKVNAKQKRAIATRAGPLDLSHIPATSRLDVQIPAATSTNSTETTHTKRAFTTGNDACTWRKHC